MYHACVQAVSYEYCCKIPGYAIEAVGSPGCAGREMRLNYTDSSVQTLYGRTAIDSNNRSSAAASLQTAVVCTTTSMLAFSCAARCRRYCVDLLTHAGIRRQDGHEAAMKAGKLVRTEASHLLVVNPTAAAVEGDGVCDESTSHHTTTKNIGER